MSEFSDSLRSEVADTVKAAWNYRDGEVVPKSEDVGLGNVGVKMQAVFLYADLADSTELVLQNSSIAAEVVKSYLRGATRLIRKNGGEVRSFDGDRVMGVFIAGAKNTAACKCALQINWFFQHALIPEFRRSIHHWLLLNSIKL
jgi:class 3 adenylate cyclase